MKFTQNHIYLLYARVSPKGSSWDAEETSISLQLEDCRNYILTRDPAAEFIEVIDEFKSGKNLNRPGIQRILSELDLTPCPWHTLVVWNLDRLSRSVADAIPIFEKLRDRGCEFISIRQDYLSATGAMARFILHQTILIAQLERETTSERVSAKMNQIASKGKVPFGYVPLGYRRKQGIKNTLEIDPENADIIREIFLMYRAGNMTFQNVQTRFPGKIKDRQYLYRILRNKIYKGILTYAGKEYQLECEHIISPKLFDEVNQMLESNAACYKPKVRLGAQKYKYLLAGLVKCHCGRYMSPASAIKKGIRYYYYKCTNALCGNAINAERLDAGVLEQIRKLSISKDFIQSKVAAYQKQEMERRMSLLPHVKTIQDDLKTIQESEDKIKNMFLSGLVTQENKDYWNKELLSVRKSREELEQKKADIESALKPADEELFNTILKTISHWNDVLSKLPDDYSVKRNLVMAILKDIQCISKGKFDINVVMSKSIKWCTRRDLNSRPSTPEADALSN